VTERHVTVELNLNRTGLGRITAMGLQDDQLVVVFGKRKGARAFDLSARDAAGRLWPSTAPPAWRVVVFIEGS